MPELPEVETIRRGLMRLVVNKKIKRVEVLCEKSFIGKKTEVEGAEITGIDRRGKALLINLNNGRTMMIHLRMTGQLIFVGGERFAGGHPSESFVGELPNKQTRVIFELEDGVLYFNDQRKFGFVKVLPTEEVEQDKFVAALGKEPWATRPEEFYEKLQRHKGAPIKSVILDQKVVAGLGNIYADEALYLAQIHPETRAGELSERQVKELLLAARTVLERGIDSGGSTLQNYVQADGSRGDYLTKFAKVFRREGEKCERCGGEIEKIRVAGRGTHICPCCQKKQEGKG